MLGILCTSKLVYFIHCWGLLFSNHGFKPDYKCYILKESNLLQWVHNPKFCSSFLFVHGDMSAHSHLLWLVGGHFSAPVIHSYQDQTWYTGESDLSDVLYPFISTGIFSFEISLMWPQCCWSFSLWSRSLVEPTCMDSYAMNPWTMFNSGVI
jgi:hypothetical protein